MLDVKQLLSVIVIAITMVIMRLSTCLPSFRQKRKYHSAKLKTMVVFGSGGHTTEMLMLIKKLPIEEYRPLHFVTAHSDRTTLAKINSSNKALSDNAVWHTIHRLREVKQSWLTTLWTSLIGSFHSFLLVMKVRPQLIICNGPGTCVAICFSSFLLRLLGVCDSHIVFVESFCRVQKLSLTGKLLYPIADKFIVQWPQLMQKYSRAEYLGDESLWKQ